MPSTSYAARQPPQQEGERPVTVLVTGFGPFLDKYPLNTSWAIASRLPALLPATPSHPTPIHIHVHHEPIRVAYSAVTSLVPAILPSSDSKSPGSQGSPYHPAPSVILHIGLAAGRTYYTLERGAHARGYGAIPDVDGLRFRDDEAEKLWPLDGFPNVIETSFETMDVWRRWRENLTPGASEVPNGRDEGMYGNGNGNGECEPLHDVRNSPDGGNFMCGFIYWNSLAHYHSLGTKRGEGPRQQQGQQLHLQDRPLEALGTRTPEKPVAFLHVPDLSSSPEKIAGGVDVAIGLIRALVESRREVGFVGDVAKAGPGDARAQTDVNFA